MAKTYVLDRVAADLARGFTHPAIQRLSSLVAAYPTDLDLRRRLAAVHRRVGNRIQAGRWDYLTIGADADDTSAFERAFPSAAKRLQEVRWPLRPSLAATAYARSRLERLVAAAEAESADTSLLTSASGSAPASRVAGADRAARDRGSGTSLVRRAMALARLPLRPWSPPRAILAVAVPVAAFFVGLGMITVVESAIRLVVH